MHICAISIIESASKPISIWRVPKTNSFLVYNKSPIHNLELAIYPQIAWFLPLNKNTLAIKLRTAETVYKVNNGLFVPNSSQTNQEEEA